MALNLTTLQDLLRKAGVQYRLVPEQPAVCFGARGTNGSYTIAVALHRKGEFLEFRTVGYRRLTDACPTRSAVYRFLCTQSHRYRWLKFTCDPSDGEIMVRGELWTMGTPPSSKQFERMLESFLAAVDAQACGLDCLLQAGTDDREPNDESDSPFRGSLPGTSEPPGWNRN